MMIKKFLLLFAAFTSLLHAEDYLLSGVDLENDTGYYDFDKIDASDIDSDDAWLCWAYSAANVLQWWQDKQDDFYIDLYQIPDGNNIDDAYESDIVSTFAAYWGNAIGYSSEAFTWWLMDTPETYQFDGMTASLFPDGGGYWSAYFADISSICTWTDVSNADSSLFLGLLSDAIVSDSGMTLSIGLNGGSHDITLWGYGVDEDGNYYLYLTDSDDTIIGEDGMQKVYISYTDNTWYLVDYYGYDWSILYLTVFDVGSVVLTVPEPSTVTLSLLALAGLCHRRRRREAVSSEQ